MPHDRPWGVTFSLAYDGGGEEWTQYYRTKFGRRVSIIWHKYIASWGGTAVPFTNKKEY
jgi:hypothetical protein